MSGSAGKKWLTILCSVVLAGCAGTEQDFCKYLSVDEARAFDPGISSAEMRQTPSILYCVYRDGRSDRLFISLDRAMDHRPVDFLRVLGRNSPEEYQELIPVTGVGDEAAALFLGDDEELKLDFFIAQDSKYSITIRAKGVASAESAKFRELKKIAGMVLPRI